MLTTAIEKTGRIVIHKIQSCGRIVLFFLNGLLNLFLPPFQFSKVIEQIWFVGTKSLFVICLTGLFTGMVLGLQGYQTLSAFGSEANLGSAVALSIIKELGPVFSAIMVAARAGSAMSSEIGVMRVSEQIDALKTMHINPVRFLFSPRIAATFISLPLLTAVFNTVGIIGGFISGSIMLDLNSNVYMDTVISSITLHDILGGFYKSFVFAIVISTISCYKGYYTHLYGGFGTRSVSLSTTSAVVQSCVFILISDYVITFFLV